MTHPIIQDPNPMLHKKTMPITGGFGSAFLERLIREMKRTLKEQDGVGLAAPQINEALSIFVIPDDIAPEVRTPSAPLSFLKPLHPTVFINPEIVYYSTTKEVLEEGCLSVKGVYKPTARSLEVKIKSLDYRGRKISVTAKGLLARVFQHETDHVNGILFIARS